MKILYTFLLLFAPLACHSRLSSHGASEPTRHRILEQLSNNDSNSMEKTWQLFGGGNIDANTNNYLQGEMHVSMSGDANTVAVGVPLWNSTQGKVVVSRYDTTLGTWQVVGQEILGIPSSHAGHVTALNHDGTRLIVGFPAGSETDWFQPQDSFARVYQLINNRWEPLGSDLFWQGASDDDVRSSFSGYAVAMDSTGTTVAVSAPYYLSGQYRLGQVRVYHMHDQSDWIQVGSSLEGSAAASHNGYVRGGDYGSSLALSGDASTLVVGSPRYGPEAGLVQTYRFDKSTEDWKTLPNITAAREVHAYTGASVDVSTDGSIIAVGHSEYKPPDETGFGGGLVRIYEFSSEEDDWVQLGGDILPDRDCCYGWGSFGDGRSLSLSGSGDTVVVAAPGSSFNGIIRGLVRVFRFDGQNWNKVGQTIPGERRHDSATGSGLVSISDDGARIVVGASLHKVCEDEADWGCNPDPDDYETWEGHARVFELQEAAAPTPTPSDQPVTASPTPDGFEMTSSPTPEGFTSTPSLAPTEGDGRGTVNNSTLPDNSGAAAVFSRNTLGRCVLLASWPTLVWLAVSLWT